MLKVVCRVCVGWFVNLFEPYFDCSRNFIDFAFSYQYIILSGEQNVLIGVMSAEILIFRQIVPLLMRPECVIGNTRLQNLSRLARRLMSKFERVRWGSFMRVSGIYCEGRPIHKRGNGERKGERERERRQQLPLIDLTPSQQSVKIIWA